MENKPITEKLFSFKTFRSPDKIYENDRERFFIHHPNMEVSVFANCPERGESVSEYESFMEGLNQASYMEYTETLSDFYAFSCRLMRQCQNDSSREEWDNSPQDMLDEEEAYPGVWEELLRRIVTRQPKKSLQECIQMIIAQKYLRLNDNSEFAAEDVSKLTVVIPEQVVRFMATWQHGLEDGALYGVYNLGVQDFRRVEQTLCCYVPGEVSHIENVMAREFKEKSSRNLLRTEETTELSSESTIENTNDTTTAERNEVSSEIAKILQKDRAFDVSGSVTVSKDSKIFGSISSNVSTGYSSSNSSSQSNTEAKNYAKEVTERAVERIEQKISEKRTYKILKEYEEIYKHGYDNRLGTAHVTGVYRWVDKIYKNDLVNYGKRMVLEVEVPHPALLYKKALKWKSHNSMDTSTELIVPKTLLEFGISNAKSITEKNASKVDEAAAYYGISIEWPIMHKYKNFSLTYNNLGYPRQTVNTEVHTEYLDEHYKCNRIIGNFIVNYKGNNTANGKVVSLFYFGGENPAGDNNYYAPGNRDMDKTFEVEGIFDPKKEDSVSCYFSYQHVGSISGSFVLECDLDEDTFSQWQRDVYTQLSQAYKQLQSRYDEDLAIQQATATMDNDTEDSENYSNETANRLIEERELKRSCIEMLSRPFGYTMGQCFYQCEDCGNGNCEEDIESIEIPQINQTVELGEFAKYVKFFETAFEWEIISYTLYPYYYNNPCLWYELLQTKSDDPVFEAFLQSGMAKVLVPVRPQFEKAVLWFLGTGDINTECNMVPETDDDQNLSLVQELQSQDEVTVDGTWETRVPSTLTIIQAHSTYLEDETGLPCSCALGESPFGSDDQMLEGLNNTETQE